MKIISIDKALVTIDKALVPFQLSVDPQSTNTNKLLIKQLSQLHSQLKNS